MSVIFELNRILQAAAEAASPTEQVSLIVDSITAHMDVDASSLYLADAEGNMVLVASHGLRANAVGSVKLAAGTGLVGLIAGSRHPLNIAKADEHPAYHYLAETAEDEFRSFAGVPLVKSGKVTGVLTAQCRGQRLLTEEELAFLVTLGTQLALVVTRDLVTQARSRSRAIPLSGIRGAPGIGIGSVRLSARQELASVVDAPCVDTDTEISHWQELVKIVRDEVRKEQAALGNDLSREVSTIFDAYQMLLGDPTLVSGVEQAIAAGNHLPGALRAVIYHYANLFLAMDDPYLRARHEDIVHLGNKLYNAWRGASQTGGNADSDSPQILVGTQVNISDIASLPQERIAGIVCFQGSSLSHTSVLANALGIPAVMGIGEHKSIREGMQCIVDGNLGQTVFEPDRPLLRAYQRLLGEESQLRADLAQLRDQPATTADGQRITLLANSGLLADLSPGLAAGAEGLGLYRTEIPFMLSETFPTEDEQLATYQQVLAAYPDKPVYMRVLDVGGDKPLPYFPYQEENPALGWRGIRFCLDNSSLLMTQVRAMLRAAAGQKSLRIMLPMVSATAELEAFHELLDDACAQLRDEGIAVVRPAVGVMVEVPAAISQLPHWHQYIDFVSVGTNDLSQYLLAVDRNNPRVANLFHPMHPAVLNEVARIVKLAAELELPLSVCGEMASNPGAALLLVGMGVRTLSMSAAQLPRIKWLLGRVTLRDAQQLFAASGRLGDAAAISELVKARMRELGLDELLR